MEDGGPMISVVIVNWNSGLFLENCVRSLIQNAPGCEVCIVDNASTDSSLRFADELKPGILIHRNSRNAGFAAANNTGWRASKGSHILFLNPDTECFPGSVNHLKEALAYENIWAVGGQLVGRSGKPQTTFNVRPFPTIGRVAAEMFFIEKIRPHQLSPQETDVDQPAAACLMVTRKALETLGGFDEAFYPAWFEDVDLCRRIRNLGGRIRYKPAARFLHHGGYSLSCLSRQDFLEIYHSNQIRYFRKHHGTGAALNAKRLIVAGLMLRSALSAILPPSSSESRTASVKAFWNAARRIAKLPEAGS